VAVNGRRRNPGIRVSSVPRVPAVVLSER